VAVDDEGAPVPLELPGDRRLERRMVGAVVALQERLPLPRRQRGPEPHALGRPRVDRAHADFRHRLERVVFEALGVDDEAADREDDRRVAAPRGPQEQLVRPGVGPDADLGAERGPIILVGKGTDGKL
jgi:hypothetical protein